MSYAGLTRVSIRFEGKRLLLMDRRIKPGDDANGKRRPRNALIAWAFRLSVTERFYAFHRGSVFDPCSPRHMGNPDGAV
jgi:hypothetical protein